MTDPEIASDDVGFFSETYSFFAKNLCYHDNENRLKYLETLFSTAHKRGGFPIEIQDVVSILTEKIIPMNLPALLLPAFGMQPKLKEIQLEVRKSFEKCFNPQIQLSGLWFQCRIAMRTVKDYSTELQDDIKKVNARLRLFEDTTLRVADEKAIKEFEKVTRIPRKDDGSVKEIKLEWFPRIFKGSRAVYMHDEELAHYLHAIVVIRKTQEYVCNNPGKGTSAKRVTRLLTSYCIALEKARGLSIFCLVRTQFQGQLKGTIWEKADKIQDGRSKNRSQEESDVADTSVGPALCIFKCQMQLLSRYRKLQADAREKSIATFRAETLEQVDGSDNHVTFDTMRLPNALIGFEELLPALTGTQRRSKAKRILEYQYQRESEIESENESEEDGDEEEQQEQNILAGSEHQGAHGSHGSQNFANEPDGIGGAGGRADTVLQAVSHADGTRSNDLSSAAPNSSNPLPWLRTDQGLQQTRKNPSPVNEHTNSLNRNHGRQERPEAPAPKNISLQVHQNTGRISMPANELVDLLMQCRAPSRQHVQAADREFALEPETHDVCNFLNRFASQSQPSGMIDPSSSLPTPSQFRDSQRDQDTTLREPQEGLQQALSMPNASQQLLGDQGSPFPNGDRDYDEFFGVIAGQGFKQAGPSKVPGGDAVRSEDQSGDAGYLTGAGKQDIGCGQTLAGKGPGPSSTGTGDQGLVRHNRTSAGKALQANRNGSGGNTLRERSADKDADEGVAATLQNNERNSTSRTIARSASKSSREHNAVPNGNSQDGPGRQHVATEASALCKDAADETEATVQAGRIEDSQWFTMPDGSDEHFRGQMDNSLGPTGQSVDGFAGLGLDLGASGGHGLRDLGSAGQIDASASDIATGAFGESGNATTGLYDAGSVSAGVNQAPDGGASCAGLMELLLGDGLLGRCELLEPPPDIPTPDLPDFDNLPRLREAEGLPAFSSFSENGIGGKGGEDDLGMLKEGEGGHVPTPPHLSQGGSDGGAGGEDGGGGDGNVEDVIDWDIQNPTLSS